jgi:hypothetical protein
MHGSALPQRELRGWDHGRLERLRIDTISKTDGTSCIEVIGSVQIQLYSLSVKCAYWVAL